MLEGIGGCWRVLGVRVSDSETITAMRGSCFHAAPMTTPLHVASRDAVSWNSGERWGDDDSASSRPRRPFMVEASGRWIVRP